jgi:glucosamine 6-phosphate synthetase-like amidotransferase/phosphosugar isomerase protein
MSGIIGIASQGNALPGLLQGLQQLAGNGHQHCGLVVHGCQGHTPSPPRLHRHRRAQGAAAWLQQLREGPLTQAPGEPPLHALAYSPHPLNAMNGMSVLNGLHGRVALGHTAAAGGTGPHALQQAHPHLSQGPKAHLNSPARVAVVVHGPLQASDALRQALIERDYHFKSNSTAELLAHLIDATCQNDPVQALQRALGLVQGPACVGVLFHDQPERVFAVQRGTPLHVAACPDLLAWASDRQALPAGLQALPEWLDGQVLEVQVSPQGITHRLHT